MGWHYTDAVDGVKRLKREGKLEEAEALLLRCVDAAEAEARKERRIPAPWYSYQLASLYRTQHDPAREVAILERFVNAAGVAGARSNSTGSKILDRLEKARPLLAASQSEPLSFCPYCGVEIAPTPKTSRACPTCGKKVVRVKRIGEELPSLLTVEQAEENVRLVGMTRARKKARERAHKLGFDARNMDEMSVELTAKWGRPPNPRDLIWALSNKAVVVAGQCRDWAAMSRAYQVQGDVLEEDGRSTTLVDEQANAALLRYYEGIRGDGEVFVSTRKACCPQCAELAGQVVQISEALAGHILPSLACTASRCRCTWRVDYGELRERSQ